MLKTPAYILTYSSRKPSLAKLVYPYSWLDIIIFIVIIRALIQDTILLDKLFVFYSYDLKLI
jgi:Na+-transporting NADH:ubiquinone oxidoreductase subunit NqrE